MKKEISDKKIKEALKKDFEELYQENYASNYKSLRIIRKVEIDIMDLENLKKIMNQEVK